MNKLARQRTALQQQCETTTTALGNPAESLDNLVRLQRQLTSLQAKARKLDKRITATELQNPDGYGCQQAKADMAQFFSRDLSREERLGKIEMAEHLKMCPRCLRRYSKLRNNLVHESLWLD